MTQSLQHILCIDDESDILEVAKMCLETMGGLQVTCLNSGTEAVAKAEGIHPDIIMLDVMMPEMDGPSTLKKLRENPALNNTPIVFMTARVQPSEIQEYMAMGAAGVVPKPFDPMQITAQVTEVWKKFHGQ